MKTDDFELIEFNKPKNWNNVIKRQKECVAFDTETFNGYMFTLCNSRKQNVNINVENLRIEGDIDLSNFTDVLNYLYQFKDTLNVFFNLGYDNDAIIKHIPHKELKQYAQIGYTIYNNWYISGIPRKSIDISPARKIEKMNIIDGLYHIIFADGEVKKYKKEPSLFFDVDNNAYMISRKVKFFDLWQFFKYENSSSLDACAQKYLGACKDDIEFFGYNKSNLPLDTIIEAYCFKDSELTEKLANVVIKACNDIGLVFNTPYSCATISSDFFFLYEGLKNPSMFLYRYGNNINFQSLDIFRHSYYAYKGGRTEVCKKGYFEECHEYDVNSMYPTKMTNLYDIFLCEWYKVYNDKEFKEYDIDNLAYAFLNCDIDLKDNYVNPLPFKHNGFYIYGYGKYNNYHISLCEYRMLVDLNLCNDIKINYGWVGCKTSNSKGDYIFKDIIERTYNLRKTFPKTDFRNSLLKIILNSIYGRFIEVNINKGLDEDIDLYNDEYIIDDDIYKKAYYAGKYFAPPYACEITAQSRCMLYQEIFKNEPENNFIGSFTDSILSKEKLKNISIGKDLGQWEYEKGELTIIGSGVYRMEIENSKDKLRTRGIHIKESMDNNFGYNTMGLDDILRYGVYQTKVKKLKESLIQDTPTEFNTFVQQYKSINLNFDKKREWDFKFNCIQDIYRECDSKIININDISLKI